MEMAEKQSENKESAAWVRFQSTMWPEEAPKEYAYEAAKIGDLSYLMHLDSLPSLLSQKNEKGHSLLMLSAYYGEEQVTEYLLGKGADPNFTDGSGNSILMGVAFKGHLNVAKLLVGRGANVAYKNPKGQDAINYALLFGRTEMVHYLKTVSPISDRTSSRLILWINFLFKSLKSFFTKG